MVYYMADDEIENFLTSWVTLDVSTSSSGWVGSLFGSLTFQKPGGNCMYHRCLTFKNSAYFLSSVFMSFVWCSEQVARCSLYNINWLSSVIETGCLLWDRK